jgi:hypothetical protein
VASPRRQSGSEESPPTEFASVPPPSTPMLDHSFTLQAIMDLKARFGSIEAKTDRLIADVKEQGTKLTDIGHQISWVKGATWVIGGLIIFAGIALGWYLSGKLSIVLKP